VGGRAARTVLAVADGHVPQLRADGLDLDALARECVVSRLRRIAGSDVVVRTTHDVSQLRRRLRRLVGLGAAATLELLKHFNRHE